MHMVFCIHRRFLFALWLPAFALLLVASGGAHGASIDPDRPTVLITGSNRGIVVALVAPGPVVTDMLQTNRPSLVLRANTPEESVTGMAAVIEGLDASYDGRPLSFDGSVVAW